MYTYYFELTEPPFSIAPDPRYFFMSPRHREALEHLDSGIRESGGFVMLTGEVGTGKTTVLRCLLVQQPEDVNIALILNPRLNAVELMASICDEFRIDYPAGTYSLKVLHDALTEYLLAAHAQNRRTVLIIDEAQNLSFEVLEQVRLLTNLETTQTKLLQIILVGQPELNRILRSKDLRQVTQRITCRYHLKAFSKRDLTADYIHHRISVSGGDASKLFTRAAIRKIHRLSGGVPRLINLICHRALNNACSQQKKIVYTKLVRQATREVRPVLVRPRFRNTAIWALAIVAVFVGGIAMGHYLYPVGLSRFREAIIANQLWTTSEINTLDRTPAQKIHSGVVGDRAERSTSPADDSFSEPSTTAKEDAIKPSTAAAGDASDEMSAAADADTFKKPTAPVAGSSSDSPAPVHIGAADNSTLPAVSNDVSPPFNETATPTASAAAAELPLFADLVRDPRLTRDAAFVKLFSQWNIQSKTEGLADECDVALKKGLRCLFGKSSWQFMRRLNRPVILEFLVKGYQKRYATLVELDDHRLTLDLGPKRLTFPLDQVLPYWKRRYILLWKPIHQNMSLLYPGDISWMVRRLRRQLAEIGIPVSTASDGASIYDEALKRHVIAFQASRGIKPDGIVGPHTMIHLNTVTNTPNIPMLERETKNTAQTIEPAKP